MDDVCLYTPGALVSVACGRRIPVQPTLPNTPSQVNMAALLGLKDLGMLCKPTPLPVLSLGRSYVCVRTLVTAESKTYETRPASFNLLNYGAKCYNIDVSWIDSNGVGWCS